VKFTRPILEQLRNLTKDDLCRALERDGWTQDESRGAVRVYLDGNGKRVTVHWHQGKTMGLKLLSGVLDDIGWNVEDLKRLKLVKR